MSIQINVKKIKTLHFFTDSETEPKVKENHISSDSGAENSEADDIERIKSFVEVSEKLELKTSELNKGFINGVILDEINKLLESNQVT